MSIAVKFNLQNMRATARFLIRRIAHHCMEDHKVLYTAHSTESMLLNRILLIKFLVRLQDILVNSVDKLESFIFGGFLLLTCALGGR